jgi:hypothetical protein
MRRLMLAFMVVSLPAGRALAETLSCASNTVVECLASTCTAGQTLYSSMSVDYARQRLDYCVGEGCYSSTIKIVVAEDGELFAFNARRTSPPKDRHSGLVTIHPGRKAATVGHFQADGAIVFSKMTCF